jgi:signal peptidase II
VSWLSNLQWPRRLHWLLLISVAVFWADRLSKNWVVAHVRFASSIPVFGHFLRVSYWTNNGAAFSMLADTSKPDVARWGLVVFTTAAAIGLLIALWLLGRRITLMTVALAMILGGALGNLHDRIAYGAVIDFIEVHIFSYHYPDFNLADSSIVTGACLLLLGVLLQPGKPPESA